MYSRNDLRTEKEFNIVERLKNKAGIYKIYFNNPIHRICDTDRTSLLYIGSAGVSNGLLKRIRDFFDSATNGTAAHSGGHFYKKALENHIGKADEVLKFEYEIKDTDLRAKDTERIELNEYLTTYGELPPLNNQLPKDI